MNYNIKVKKTLPYAIIPTKGSEDAAGYDLYAVTENGESVSIDPNTTAFFDTGIAIQIPRSHVGLMFARSSIGIKRGLILCTSVSVIDSDYRGSIKVALKNIGKETQEIEHGERIAQLVIMPYLNETSLFEVNELDTTARGTGGIGSTGRK